MTFYDQYDTDPVIMQTVDFDPFTQSDIVIGGLGKNNGGSEHVLVLKLSS